MERFTPIRITKNDRTEYARLVRNARAKIRRTEKNYGIDLSKEIELPSLKQFTTRKGFNQWKEQVSSFTNRNNLHYQFKKNKYDVVATKKELMEIDRHTKKAQRLAEKKIKEIENLPIYQGGKKQVETVGQHMMTMAHPDVGITVPKDFNFDAIQTKRDLERRREIMEEKSSNEYYDRRNKTMRDNFIGLIQRETNGLADSLVGQLLRVPPDDFYELFVMFKEFDFNLFYKPEGVDFGSDEDWQALEMIEYYLQSYEQGSINMDLKTF